MRPPIATLRIMFLLDAGYHHSSDAMAVRIQVNR